MIKSKFFMFLKVVLKHYIRWATHGEPSDVNSHPHSNGNASISVVHNGIIENYMRLREWLTENG